MRLPPRADEGGLQELSARLAESANWQGRCAALRELSSRFRSSGVDEGGLCALRDSKCAARLGGQLLDLRSEVTREASACVAALAEEAAHLPAFAGLAAETLTGPLLRLVAVPHKVMSDQGHAAASLLFASLTIFRALL